MAGAGTLGARLRGHVFLEVLVRSRRRRGLSVELRDPTVPKALAIGSDAFVCSSQIGRPHGATQKELACSSA